MSFLLLRFLISQHVELATYLQTSITQGLVLPYIEILKRNFRSQLLPLLPACKAHNCSCHCCCPAELVDPHLDLLGGTVTGEAGARRGSWVPAAGTGASVFALAHSWGWPGCQPGCTEHTTQRLRNALDIFTCISNPDREPKYAFYRLSYFPSSTDLRVYIFEQNSKSLVLSPERQKKASVIIAHIF